MLPTLPFVKAHEGWEAGLSTIPPNLTCKFMLMVIWQGVPWLPYFQKMLYCFLWEYSRGVQLFLLSRDLSIRKKESNSQDDHDAFLSYKFPWTIPIHLSCVFLSEPQILAKFPNRYNSGFTGTSTSGFLGKVEQISWQKGFTLVQKKVQCI